MIDVIHNNLKAMWSCFNLKLIINRVQYISKYWRNVLNCNAGHAMVEF